MTGGHPRVRIVEWAACCGLLAIGTIAYLYWTRPQASGGRGADDAPLVVNSLDMTELTALRRAPHLVFRNMAPGPEHGALSFASLEPQGTSLEPQGRRYTTNIFCQRVYFKADTGLCLTLEQRPRIRERAYLFDAALAIRERLDLPGVPSRARVSPDGHLAAFTVFVGGDSYAKLGFSTRTRIIAAGTGHTIADLEEFQVLKGGAHLTAPDFNYWGVTFSRDGVTFYATLGTNGQKYLVRGNLRSRQVEVLRGGVECPSLSPDERHIAFKQEVSPGSRSWQPAVLGLSDLDETRLPEARSVDDQIEWLDDAHVLYGIREGIGTIPDRDGVRRPRANIWMLAADGTGSPKLFLEDGESPAIVSR
jgi:hypothetical protein